MVEHLGGVLFEERVFEGKAIPIRHPNSKKVFDWSKNERDEKTWFSWCPPVGHVSELGWNAPDLGYSFATPFR